MKNCERIFIEEGNEDKRFINHKKDSKGKSFISLVETTGHMGMIRNIAYTPDGRYIVTASEDKTVRVWERQTGRLVKVIRGQIGPGSEGMLYTLTISSNGNLIATGGYFYGAKKYGTHILIYSLSDGRLVKRLTGREDVIHSLAFSPDGRYLASGNLNNTIIIWDTRKWGYLRKLKGHEDSIYRLAFMLNSEMLVSASYDSTLRVWDVKTSKCIHVLKGHEAEVFRVAVSKDGLIVSGLFDHTIKIWLYGSLIRTLKV